MVIDRTKRSNKTLSEVKLVKNVNKNPQSFLKVSFVQNKVPPTQKLQHDTYE